MGQQQVKRTESSPSKKKQRGIVGAFIYFIWLVVLMSLLAWFFVWIGFVLYQISEGEDKTQRQMNNIIEANTALLKSQDHFLVGNAYTAFESGENSVLCGVLVKAHTLDSWQWLRQKIQQGGDLVQERAPNFKNKAATIWHRVVYPLLTVFLGASVIVGTRLFIFLLSLPLFLLFVGLGCVDGLVQRDVRKFQAARESTYLFHRIKRTWKSCFFVPLFLYFVWPFATNSVWFLMSMALWLGLMMQISLQSFKKYV